LLYITEKIVNSSTANVVPVSQPLWTYLSVLCVTSWTGVSFNVVYYVFHENISYIQQLSAHTHSSCQLIHTAVVSSYTQQLSIYLYLF